MKLETIVTLAILLTVMACGTNKIVQTTPRVAEATTRIKAALIEAPQIDAASVLVEQIDKIIVLSGFVDSAANKTTAVKIAQDTSGLQVVDKLQVK